MPKDYLQYEPFPSWYADEDIILMLDFGYDESGSKHTLLVSAQIGQTKRLRRFSRKWQRVLSDAGIEYFHAKDYANKDHGVFQSLNAKERKRLVQRLGRLIRDFMDVGFTARIDERIYRAEMGAKLGSKWGSAYSYAAQAIVMASHLYYQQKKIEEPANILLENGHRNVGDVVNRLSDLKREHQYLAVYIRSCGGGWKKDHPILQAADMLAYSEWQAMNQAGRDMFDALNVDGNPYQPILFDCDEKLISATKRGIDAFRAHKKAFWESHGRR